MEHIYKIAFFVVVSFSFVFNQVLSYLNNKSSPLKIPSKLRDFYNQEKYSRSLQYKSEHYKLERMNSWMGFIVTLGLLLTGGFGFINQVLLDFGLSGRALSLAYFGVLFFLNDAISLPFSLYSTFVIEEKFGFNTSSFRIFIIDKLKSYALGIIIGGLFLYVFLAIIHGLGSSFWIYGWMILTVISLLVNFLYVRLFLPIFNKIEPLPSGDLKTAIETLAEKLDFPLRQIMVMDASKRSAKSNAFFSGFGRQKTIVLYDTLLEKFSNEELVGILAHEVGHYKKKHIYTNMISTSLLSGVTLLVLSWFIFSEDLSIALGENQIYYHLNLIAFGILYKPINTISSLFGNYISRKHEYEADEFAVRYCDKGVYKNALKKLSTENLSDLSPHPYFVFAYYSHPTVLQRISAIDENNQ